MEMLPLEQQNNFPLVPYSEEISEDVHKCYNFKEIESQGDPCASCRWNLTRWRIGPTSASKYFASVNSRGQPCINRSTIAQKNCKTAILQGTLPFQEFSLLVSLLEDLFLLIAGFLSASDISRLQQTCRYANRICQFNILWKLLLRRDFPNSYVISTKQFFPTLFFFLQSSL